MIKFIAAFLRKLYIKLGEYQSQSLLNKQIIEQEVVLKGKKYSKKKLSKNNGIKPNIKHISCSEKPIRDIMEIMEFPFVALSKNRKTPIIYENLSRGVKLKVSRHTGHFLASIYDWDIILFVANKMQEIINLRLDIPPRTMIFQVHDILKGLHRHEGKKQREDIEKSLARLNLTGIETSIRNEDFRYKGGFGFLDSWEYTERKDIKEVKITLSQWLYDGICSKESLLRVDPSYFDLTSAIKRFLYRTARKHVGYNKNLEFSIEKLYEKSGSERELRKFKSDLKRAVLDNDIPEYSLQWIKKGKKEFVSFENLQPQKMETILLI